MIRKGGFKVKFDINKISNWMLKIATVLFTGHGTWVVVAENLNVGEIIYVGGIGINFEQLFLQVSLVVIVEATFLMSWVNYDQRKAKVKGAGDLIGAALFVWGMYAVILTIGGIAGTVVDIVARVPIALALAYDTYDGLAATFRKFQRNEKRKSVPMLERLANFIFSNREGWAKRRAEFIGFKGLKPELVDNYQHIKRNQFKAEKINRLEKIKGESKNLTISPEFSAGELLGTDDALAYMNDKGLSRTDTWLRNQANQNDWLGQKEGRAWVFSQENLDRLVEKYGN